MLVDPHTPVIIGVGQAVSHWDGSQHDSAPSPRSLRRDAAARALADTGAARAVAECISDIYVVRTMLDSIAGAPQPFGRSQNPPGALAIDLSLSPTRTVYSAVGGDQPQALVNEAAEAIHAGRITCALLVGAEATAALKTAQRLRRRLQWADDAAGSSPLEDRGLGSALLSDYEIKNGLGVPTETYPLFENALRVRLGHSTDEHRRLMSELWSSFSEVAAANPYAQFPTARSTEFLSTPSAENYALADPYLKWDVAQDAVNQGAAVIMTSVAKARALGIDPSKLVYLHGYAEVADKLVSARADLSRSQAMELTLAHALASAGLSAADIEYFDLYSCFPCAVLIAAECLGLDWRAKPATVTGGLPFFGGPGNNYSMHAIATMVERLRQAPGEFGLVLANGGYLSKEAVGIYSATPKTGWAPISSKALAEQIAASPSPPLVSTSGEAVIETYTVTWRKGRPHKGHVVARTPEGRVVGRVRTGHRATLAALRRTDPIGKTIRLTHEGGVNYVQPADRIGETQGPEGRAFKFVAVQRRGHVLEVELNRPENMNALHSAAHFELHEIWDEFERDPDLWVAIVTGAGDRAFCSGNDLKATARGGDMSLPRSSFGGLCERFNREKPIIAAVNGVAMGGGMEIVLACDLAVADERARFALPEVKVGLFAAAGGVQRLTRQIGRKAAVGLILTGRHIEAAEALQLGVINEVTPAGGALEAARVLADTLLANSPSAIRASKQALNKLDEIDALATALQANGPIFGQLMRTNDFREGVTAFAEKRRPNWTNS